ncbi:DUF2971 domain-containing protein [Alteromonas macleodii]|jgi:hypothetical protein|uniref:DUF2971 domain-containing protein n=1 Tax=Alteromonas macleodii TaxID=28108 RepID=UPI001930E37D|nr:DUF2971 domain-containing protein [Alteromonas macleodii]|tara:strand:- start:87 stop:812 length:726 start_codon:yes stop_codon:yes gene_type:complete
MEHKNYINIDYSDRGAKIYRIMTVDRLLDMFETKTNVLVKPCLWDDPFENFLFNTPMVHKNGTEYVSILRDRAYGQCWSLNVESDAMWRIYAPEKNGVKIQTTISSLYNSLYQGTARYPRISCFIGKVDYHPKSKLTALAKQVRDNGKSKGGSHYQAKSLLMKRVAFKHEDEVRLIYLDPNNIADQKIHKYKFDPMSHIKSMTFDPRMGESLYRVYKKHIESLGFSGKIIQSGLYKEMKLI